MDHTIQAAIERIQKQLNSIPANLNHLSEEEARAYLTFKRACDHIDALSLCINVLMQVVRRIAAKEKMMSDDLRHQY